VNVLHTDCLVIGGGLAGSAYALYAAEAGLEVTLLSLGKALEANSDWAQGGIIYDASGDGPRAASSTTLPAIRNC
jgi:L-aspartate oxidase